MKHELENDDAVVIQHLLQVVDLIVPGEPLLLLDRAVHPWDQHVLVVRPVEDPDHPALRHLRVHPPQEIVALLELRRGLEARHAATLWIDRREDPANRAVLARRVPALQNYEERVPCIRIENALKIGDPLDVLLGDALQRFAALEGTMNSRTVVVQLDRAFRIDGLELHRASLSTAHRGEHEYRGSARYRRPQAVEETNVLTVHEEIDVASNVAALVHDAVARTG